MKQRDEKTADDRLGGKGQRLALSSQEAADALSVSIRTVDSLIADRTSGFPFRKIGARVVIPCDLLDDWLKSSAQSQAERN